MIKSKKVIKSRFYKSLCFSLVTLGAVTVGAPSNYSLNSSFLKKKEPVLVLKNESSRQKNTETNVEYGAILSGGVQQFNYLIKTDQTFIFTFTYKFQTTDINPFEMYKSKYVYKTNDFLKNLAKYAYKTEKAIYNFDFTSINNSDFIYPANFLSKYPEFSSLITSEGTSYNYDETNPTRKKPRMILGIVKDGVLYDYVTYSNDPYYFTYPGMNSYLDTLTYTKNIYTAQFKEFQNINSSMICAVGAVSNSTIGCRLGNDENSYLIYYNIYGAQYFNNLLTKRDFLLYNYDPYNKENRDFMTYELTDMLPQDSKIYAADTAYYTYEQDSIIGYNSKSPIKLTEYNTTTINNIPIYKYDTQNSNVSKHSSIEYSHLPYVLYARNGSYVDFSMIYDYSNIVYDYQTSVNPKNSSEFNSLLSEKKTYQVTTSDNNYNASILIQNGKVYSVELTKVPQNYDISKLDQGILTIDNEAIDVKVFTDTYLSNMTSTGKDISIFDDANDVIVQIENESAQQFFTNYVNLICSASELYLDYLGEYLTTAKENDIEFMNEFIEKYWREI